MSEHSAYRVTRSGELEGSPRLTIAFDGMDFGCEVLSFLSSFEDQAWVPSSISIRMQKRG